MTVIRWPVFFMIMFAANAVSANEYAVTPFYGYRFSDALIDDNTGVESDLDDTTSFGLLLSQRRDNESYYDFLFSRQATVVRSPGSVLNNRDVRIYYYHIGGTVDYEDDVLHPFATGGFGLTHASAPGSGLPSETKLSMSLGGGLKFPVTEQVDLRFEARAYGTTISGVTRILCSGGCSAQFNGSLYFQFDFNAGLTVLF